MEESDELVNANSSRDLIFRTINAVKQCLLLNFTCVLRFILGKWVLLPVSAWYGIETLSGSQWYLDRLALFKWLSSNQRSPLMPCSSGIIYRLHLVNAIFVLQIIRIVLCMITYNQFEEVIVNGEIVKPRYPYYFGDVYQQLTTFSIYFNVSAGAVSIYCLLSSVRFYLSNYQNDETKRSLYWFRVLLCIHAMVHLKPYQAKQSIHLLRFVPMSIYQRYQHKFITALRVQTLGVKGNNFFILLFFLTVMQRVMSHPEWNFPFLPTVYFNLCFQIWYYLVFRTIYCLLIMFYLNSTFITMLLLSLHEQTKRCGRNRTLLSIFRQLCSIQSLLRDINRFWGHHLGNYYIFLLPCCMTSAYVLLFVGASGGFYYAAVYVVATYLFSMHFNNWEAAKVRNSALQLYRILNQRRLVSYQTIETNTKVKILNVFDLLTSKSCRFGIKIDALGVASQKASFILVIATIRVFLSVFKIANNLF